MFKFCLSCTPSQQKPECSVHKRNMYLLCAFQYRQYCIITDYCCRLLYFQWHYIKEITCHKMSSWVLWCTQQDEGWKIAIYLYFKGCTTVICVRSTHMCTDSDPLSRCYRVTRTLLRFIEALSSPVEQGGSFWFSTLPMCFFSATMIFDLTPLSILYIITTHFYPPHITTFSVFSFVLSFMISQMFLNFT